MASRLFLLYFLTMARPSPWVDRAARFTDLYVDPAHAQTTTPTSVS